MLLAAGGWDLVVFDEAHRLARDDRGRSTLRYKLAQALRAKTDRMILLTGTPHQGDAGKFRNLLTLVRPDLSRAVSAIETDPDVVQEIVLRNRKIDVVGIDGEFLFKGLIVRRATIAHDPNFEALERQLQDYLRQGYRAVNNVGTRGKRTPLQSAQRWRRSSWRRQPSQHSRPSGPGRKRRQRVGSVTSPPQQDGAVRIARRRRDEDDLGAGHLARRLPRSCRTPSTTLLKPWMYASERLPPWVFMGSRPSGQAIAPSTTGAGLAPRTEAEVLEGEEDQARSGRRASPRRRRRTEPGLRPEPPRARGAARVVRPVQSSRRGP